MVDRQDRLLYGWSTLGMRFHARVSFAQLIDSGVIMVKGLRVKLKNDKMLKIIP